MAALRPALAAVLLLAAVTPPAMAAGWEEIAERGCTALADAVHAVEGDGPAFIASYRPAAGEAALPPALDGAAFTYDQALSVIALTGCGRLPEARRIADALVIAAGRDRFYEDGRVRNAYRAGPVPDRHPPLPGWWDAAAKLWVEDRYQAGSATGNVAWAALALLTAAGSTDKTAYREAANRLLDWVALQRNDREPAGYAGGTFGHEPHPDALTWKSTEHNLDAYAAFTLAGREGEAATARRFLDWAFQADEHLFLVGTGPDGTTPNRDNSGLDSQLWPLLAVHPLPPGWISALDRARRVYAFGPGLGFKAAPDGMWTEGTAQMALALRRLGREAEAAPLADALAGQRAANGFFYAADRSAIRTGLAIGPASTTDDFRYYRIPHLAATAWAVLAALDVDPFAGAR